jgi:regulatory protein
MANPDEEQVARAFRAGLRFVSYRPRSRQEIRRRLGRRFGARTVEQALARLEEQGYVDDATFARFWRESREAHRPRSAGLVRRELAQRGVGREEAEEAVAGLDDDANAYRAGLGRMRSLRGLDYVTFRRRLEGYLTRRGFGTAIVRRAVERLWREHLS